MLHGVPQVALHNGMPFGATASVVAWHRVAALINAIARKVLFLPTYVYVDDFFATERREVTVDWCAIHGIGSCVYNVCRPEAMEHSMLIFARLVRLLLGESAVAERKLECGRELVILGVKVRYVYT